MTNSKGKSKVRKNNKCYKYTTRVCAASCTYCKLKASRPLNTPTLSARARNTPTQYCKRGMLKQVGI